MEKSNVQESHDSWDRRVAKAVQFVDDGKEKQADDVRVSELRSEKYLVPA